MGMVKIGPKSYNPQAFRKVCEMGEGSGNGIKGRFGMGCYFRG